jgi:hypothetical protein
MTDNCLAVEKFTRYRTPSSASASLAHIEIAMLLVPIINRAAMFLLFGVTRIGQFFAQT